MINAAQAFMLADIIDTYLPLSTREREELRVQWEAQEGRAMGSTRMTWADEIMLHKAMETRREDIREVIRYKFGEVPSDVDAAIDNATTEQALMAFLHRAAVARTTDDLLSNS